VNITRNCRDFNEKAKEDEVFLITDASATLDVRGSNAREEDTRLWLSTASGFSVKIAWRARQFIDQFAIIVACPSEVVCLLGQNHLYSITEK
jgi:hypothetical protein